MAKPDDVDTKMTAASSPQNFSDLDALSTVSTQLDYMIDGEGGNTAKSLADIHAELVQVNANLVILNTSVQGIGL